MNALTTKHRSTSVSTIQISLDYKEENYIYLKCSQWLLQTVHIYKNHTWIFTVSQKPFHVPLLSCPQQGREIPCHERPYLGFSLPSTSLTCYSCQWDHWQALFLHLSDLQHSHQNMFEPGTVAYTSNPRSWKVWGRKIKSSRPVWWFEQKWPPLAHREWHY